MLYKILADTIVFIHFLWILFLLSGVFFGLRYKVLRIVHISGLVFALIIQVFHWYCPLTYLEVWLRERHDPSLSYTGSFIVQYIERIVYIEISQKLIFIGSILLSGLTIWLYLRKSRKAG